jgi:hypothetical protein
MIMRYIFILRQQKRLLPDCNSTALRALGMKDGAWGYEQKCEI